MKKGTSRLVIGLMIVALTGLVGFQVYWIGNAWALSKTQFSRNVQESLMTVVDRLEKQESVAMTASASTVIISSNHEDPKRYSYQTTYETLSDGDTLDWQKNGHSQIKVVLRDMKDPVNTYVLSGDSVIYVTSKKENHEKLRNKVRVVDLALNKMLEKETEHIDRRINEQNLDSLLISSLDAQGIHLGFHYAVVNGVTDSVVMSNEKNTPKTIVSSPYKALLFPNDLRGQSNYLSLTFPDKNTFFLHKIWMTLTASILLIGIIIACFIYTYRILMRQKRISEVKNDFINNMTHEFKTPLATISLATQFLIENPGLRDAVHQKKYLEVISQENDRLSDQVEKVLQTALMDKEDFQLAFEETDVRRILEAVVEKFDIHVKGGELMVNFDPLPHTLDADPHYLNYAFSNILDNAIKYSNTEIRITICTKVTPDKVFIEFRDQGIGMTKEAEKHIFDRFYRVSTGNRHDVKGFGLGLSFVKRVVELHHGIISVESELEKGSTFRIQLPHE